METPNTSTMSDAKENIALQKLSTRTISAGSVGVRSR